MSLTIPNPAGHLTEIQVFSAGLSVYASDPEIHRQKNTSMSKYHVYAIGNALVDIEYHATAHRLTELGIDKGVMTLIDEQQQNSLMAQLGESHEKMACGGSAANTVPGAPS